MHFLVIIAAVIVILSFVSNNPNVVGKFIGSFAIGLVLFIVFAIFVIAPHDHKTTASKSMPLFAFDQAAVTSVYKPPANQTVTSPGLSDKEAKLLRYGQRLLDNKSQEESK